ncbi:MAG: DGQHR domain-containing protein [Endozoicomonadaceae bacterium]|nr:DGQHR domain-containing protein [Endozoicomonadaceae bacterium]
MSHTTPISVMTSPSNKALPLTLFIGKEGINNAAVDTYEGVITFGELVEHFQVEANSDSLDEIYKKQRDVDSARIEGLKRYWKNTTNSVFPNMTFFANDLAVKKTVNVGTKKMAVAELAPLADRFICDGQGRTSFIQWLLSQDEPLTEEFRAHTISFKLLVTGTESLSTPKAIKVIKQTFADYHCNLKKPNKSISKCFDSSTAFSRMLNELLDMELTNGKTVRNRIALHGNIRKGHVWTFAQFSSMIQKLLNVTPASASAQLKDEVNYDVTVSICTSFLGRVFDIMPTEMLDSDNHKVHEDVMFSKAIFADALGFVGRSLLDEMLIDEQANWTQIKTLSLPIDSKIDKQWLKNKVTFDDEGRIKIIKGTNKRLASLICSELRIYPCPALTL